MLPFAAADYWSLMWNYKPCVLVIYFQAVNSTRQWTLSLRQVKQNEVLI